MKGEPIMQVNHDQIKAARTADLYSFLLTHHSSAVRRSGNFLYLLSDESISIHRGYPGYHDFGGSNEHGNSIDFLVKFMDYRFVDAVTALAGQVYTPGPEDMFPPVTCTAEAALIPPEPSGSCRQLYAYLCGRAIPADVITMLRKKGVLYQEAAHNNLVFLSPEKDCFEQRGTFTYTERPFRQNRRASPGRCWYFIPSDTADRRVYVCEAAIDAVSLYVLHKKAGLEGDFMYASLGGVCNQKPLDRFLEEGLEVVIAVDNDRAGDECRKRYSGVRAVIPQTKDWNEDLAKGIISSSCF